MNTTRVLTQPTYSITLLLLVIGTLTIIIVTIPTLMLFHEQDQLSEGIGIFLSALAILSPLPFSIYGVKQAEIDKGEKKLDGVGDKYVRNLIVINLTDKEAALRAANKLDVGEQLKAADLDPEDIKAMIPPELSDRADILLNGVSQVTELIDLRRNIAQQLEQNSEELKFLVVEAVDEVLAQLSENHLKKLGLCDLDSRGSLYGDIYLYLRGWLKSSIEYDVVMPLENISQSHLDRKLYIDIIKQIREYQLDDFGLKNDRQINTVKRHLNILVDRLED